MAKVVMISTKVVVRIADYENISAEGTVEVDPEDTDSEVASAIRTGLLQGLNAAYLTWREMTANPDSQGRINAARVLREWRRERKARDKASTEA